MNYSGSLVFLDGIATTAHSLGLVTLKLAQGLRDKSIPSMVTSYGGASDPDFHMARHLVGIPAPPALNNTFGVDSSADFIYVDLGQAFKPQLSLAAKKSIVIIPLDDIRWSFKHYAKYLSKVDEVLTFSTHSQEYLSRKLKRPVGLLPLGVDTKDFYRVHTPVPPTPKVFYKNFSIPLAALRHTYRFLSIGFMQERKGISELLQAYYKGFYGNPNVSLWIHGRSGAWSDGSAISLLKGFDDPNAPLLVWTDSALSTSQLNQLLNFASCYVSPHHLEGFGLMPLQALAVGLPVIATAFSGPMDYLTYKNASLLPARETTKLMGDNRLPWGEYKLSNLIDLMRSYPEPKENTVTRTWTWERSVKYLTKYLPEPGKVTHTKNSGGSTICIPCYKVAQKLDVLLNSLRTISAAASYEILVGNDGNDPEVSKTCVKHNVRAISSPTRTGVAIQRNILAAAATTEWLVYLDADTIITTPGWLGEWKHSHSNANADLSTVLHFYPDGTVNYSGHVGESCNPCYKKSPSIQCQLPLPIDYAQGSALLGRTELFRTYPFHPEYTLYYDDYDFSAYLRRHGKSLWYFPQISLIHDAHTTKTTVGLTPSDNGEALFNSFWKA